jgi:RNA polymerase sigma-70 factor (ECF subfamily)
MPDKETEFRKIHSAFQPKIFRYLTRLVGNEDAEDLTQEVFVKVNKGLNSFRGESKLSTWIYKIATNTALDRLRSPSFCACKTPIDASVEEADADTEDKDASIIKANMPSAEQELVKKEMNECIQSFINNLPAEYRAVILLSEIEEFKNKEIAKILGITLDAVKIRLHRARTKLKKELEANCNFYRDEQNELACDLKQAFKEF